MFKKILIFIFVACIFGGFVGYKFYKDINDPNVTAAENDILLITEGATLSNVVQQLSSNSQIIDTTSFKWVADKMKYKKVKAGRFLLTDGMSNRALVSLLRSGKQKAIKLTFNNMRTIEELSGHFGKILEPDSLAFYRYFMQEKVLTDNALTTENIMSLFIPNTYEVYWNTTPDKLLTKMKNEHNKFWNEERMVKLEKIDMTKEEVYTLASIVQKETNVNSEKPTIAGVYMNRLRRGQLLQADPTVVFAVGDFGIRRVLNKHIATDSPYNTYKYEGLPPGPIFMPDVTSIDAVLKNEKHSYLYFCASPDLSGKHQFAKNLVAHNANANKYRQWLNERKIYK